MSNKSSKVLIDYKVLFFARIKSNDNRRSFYKIGQTQHYVIRSDNKLLTRTEQDRYRELKREIGNEFFENGDIKILRQLRVPTSSKVVYNANFHEHMLRKIRKPTGGFFNDCYENTFETYKIIMDFFNSCSDGLNDLINYKYRIDKNNREYYDDLQIIDTFYTAEDYLNEDDENWSSDEDNGSHLESDNNSSDDFLASDDDLDMSDGEYVPKKRQKV